MKVFTKFLCTTAASFCLVSASFSADPTSVKTWIGAGGDNNMSNGGNWDDSIGLVAGDSYQWIFQGSSQTRPLFNDDYGITTVILSNNLINAWQANGGLRTLYLGSFFISQSPPSANAVSYFASPFLGDVYLADADSGSATTFDMDASSGFFRRVDFHGTLHDGPGTSSTLIKNGGGVLQIGGVGNNDYTGGTIVNGGRLQLFKQNQFENALPAGGAVTVNNSADISLNQWHVIADDVTITLNDSSMFRSVGVAETLEAIQSTSAGTVIDLGGRTDGPWEFIFQPSAAKTYNGGTGVAEFHGTVQGAANGSNVRKDGDGTLVLAGNNTYASSTVVNDGTLKLNGNNTSSGGTVTVNGGTFLAKGTIGGSVTVYSPGTLGAGFSAGSLTLSGGLNLESTNVWELAAYDDSPGGAGTSYDQIQMSGSSVNLSGAAVLQLGFGGAAANPDGGNPFWSSARSWNVITGAGSISGALPVANGVYAAGTFTTSVSGGNVVLSFTPSGAPAPVRPRITSVTGAGTTSVVVSYTNTIPGTNYVLRYSTNLNTPNWTVVGTKQAVGTSDSQTDTPPIGSPQRLYRVHYVTP